MFLVYLGDSMILGVGLVVCCGVVLLWSYGGLIVGR